jgi:hypothetical protein
LLLLLFLAFSSTGLLPLTAKLFVVAFAFGLEMVLRDSPRFKVCPWPELFAV